jgi:DNA-binding transcriptional MerR regulator
MDTMPSTGHSSKSARRSEQSRAVAESEEWATIGDIARDFDVTLRTLRFYEARGLLTPRREGMNRYYSAQDRARLELILKGKRLGFTLSEIRAMVAQGSEAKPSLRMECQAAIAELEDRRTHLISGKDH